MKVHFLGLCLAALVSGTAFGDCTVSKQFEVKTTQRFATALLDHSGSAIGHARIELLLGKRVARSAETDALGNYDLGEIAPGTYRLRIRFLPSNAFCAPEVTCTVGECKIQRDVPLNPKAPTLSVN